MSKENLQESFNDSESEDDDDEEKRTLFCANLDERVTEDLLYEVFLQAGPIDSVRIPKDPSGRQRTFGFITYVQKCSLPYAMLLYQGLSLYRKTVTIKHQGNTQPSPMRNYISPGSSNQRPNYDNSSLRGCSYYSNNENPPQNPFKTSYSPDYPSNSGKHQHNIAKHATPHRRSHINSSPYQRQSGGNGSRDNDKERDHNRKRYYNNGSNRHSDQRPGGKNRR